MDAAQSSGQASDRFVEGDRRVDDRYPVFVFDSIFAPAEDAATLGRFVAGDRRVFDGKDRLFARSKIAGFVFGGAVVLDSARIPDFAGGVVARHERALDHHRAAVVGDPAPIGCGAFGDPVFAEEQVPCRIADVAAEFPVFFVGVGGSVRDLEPDDAGGAFRGVVDVEHSSRVVGVREHVHRGGARSRTGDHERLPDRERAVVQCVFAGRDLDDVGRARWRREPVLVFDQLPQRAGAGGGCWALFAAGRIFGGPHRVGRCPR